MWKILPILLMLVAPARAGDIPVHWDFVPNLGNDANYLQVPWNGNWNWLRNPNSSTASTLPIYWTSDIISSPALEDMDKASLWVVILPSTSVTIRLVHFRDGFNVRTAIKTQWFAWPGYGWMTMRMDVTDQLKAVAADIWANDVSSPGHHLGIQIMGQADIRRATLTIQ